MKGLGCLLILALAAGCLAEPKDCDLKDAAKLSKCVKELLMEKRADVKRKADPLRIPDSREGDVHLWNGRITGLSNYNVEQLSLKPSADKIEISTRIVWTNVRAEISARAKKCKRIIFKVCGSVSARPKMSIARTVGTLRTTLQIAVHPDGSLAVTPSGTAVDISFTRPHVDANIKSKVARFFNKIFGDPASSYMRKKALRYWDHKKPQLLKQVAAKLDDAIVKNLAISLQDLLH